MNRTVNLVQAPVISREQMRLSSYFTPKWTNEAEVIGTSGREM